MNVIEGMKKAQKLLDAREPDEAWDIIDGLLKEDPNDPRLLIAAADIQEKARRWTVAYQFAERAVHAAPNIAGSWLIFGRMCDLLYRFQEAEMAYKKALALAPNPHNKAIAMMNLGGLFYTMARWEDSEEWSRKALEIAPSSVKAKGNLGMACLAQRKWSEGWRMYDAIIGLDTRVQVKYGDEPTWAGEKNKTVVVHGEQGLGDEVTFSSFLPDLIRDSKKVIIDCDHRLEGLFKRSFPKASVHGTRWAKAGDATWPEEDHKFDSSITMGGLGKYYRTRDAQFTKTPHLIPDPERVKMWKGLFDTMRPVYGIAWSGGLLWTGEKFRTLTLEQLKPLLGSVHANWVSLQYKDASKEIEAFTKANPRISVKQYPFGTLTKDYDDTAAMIAAMDGIVSVPTSIVHLASALGVPCLAMKAPLDCWKFASELLLPGVRFIPHVETWEKTIAETIPVLEELCLEKELKPRLSELPSQAAGFGQPLSSPRVMVASR